MFAVKNFWFNFQPKVGKAICKLMLEFSIIFFVDYSDGECSGFNQLFN